MNKFWLIGSTLLGLWVLGSFCELATAQLVPDGSLGAESSSVTRNVNTLRGRGDRINGGAIRGANLFHSFSEFNVNTGQRVYFSNPIGVENILTRVTGNNDSSIAGVLGVDGEANLYLLNPNGIIFGRGARLDVRGSFVATTADAIQFGNLGSFDTSPSSPENLPLLTINPSALIFNQSVPSPISVENTNGITVLDGQDLLIVGGQIGLSRSDLEAPGGQVELGALAQPALVALEQEETNGSIRYCWRISQRKICTIKILSSYWC